ncbi:MAG: Na+:solute symporter [Bacteriovoracaceae bacterium]|nr:Na+:solute symporter [Bacteriovoracaceae bacterium]
MHLSVLDWTIVVGYLVLSVAVGIYFSKKATQSIDDFFVAGRSLPWWLAGITMAASALAIDTPLGIMGLVGAHGIQGVWYAWSFVLGGAGALGAFVFASLLRRSEVITIAELVELRYSGKSAAFLRCFKGVYFGIFANAITLGWVIKAVFIINKNVFGFNPHWTLAIVLTFTLFYTAMSGMFGIVATDFIQFIIGIIGVFTLAIMAWNNVGGLEQIIAGLTERFGEAGMIEKTNFFPDIDSPFFVTFIVFISFKWWGNPPPAIHQRIVSAKNEKHASFATLFFAVTSFAINYWPMIVIAIISLVMFPQLKEVEHGYGLMMIKLLPSGLLGLMVASMMAAFMSTVDTHINYGASYMVKDIYQRFIKKNASKKHYVRASQISTVIMLLVSVLVAYSLESVREAWYYMAMLTAGYGFLIVIRWFWWRVNAWSEIAALAGSGIGSTLLSSKFAKFLGYWDIIGPWGYGWRFIFILIICTIVWVTITFLTSPSDEKTLEHFCRKVKPFPTFWGPIHKKYPDIEWNPHFIRCTLHWIFGSIGIFSMCFGIGNMIFKSTVLGLFLINLSIVIFVVIYLTWKDVKKTYI